MKRCGVCGKRYRGQGTRVFVAARHDALGGLQRVRGCPSCAQQAIHLALPKRAVPCGCGATASLCAGCANEGAPKTRALAVAGLARKLLGLMRAYPPGNPMHAGLSLAVEVIAAGDWEVDAEPPKGGA